MVQGLVTELPAFSRAANPLLGGGLCSRQIARAEMRFRL